MTKSQIKVFEQLLADDSFKGKKHLQHLLWLNTSKPKFKIGDCFKVDGSSGHKVYGHLVKGFNAKVVKIYSYKDSDEWYYELEMDIECGDKKTVSKEYKCESELQKAKKCNDNKNKLGAVV